MTEVQARPGQGNNDLTPPRWLIERWCKHGWGEGVRLGTPTGRQLHLSCWHRMPYLAEEQINALFEDLPATWAPGRTGQHQATE